MPQLSPETTPRTARTRAVPPSNKRQRDGVAYFNPFWVATALRYAAGRQNHITISREDLSKLTRLHEASHSHITKEMKRRGWIDTKRAQRTTRRGSGSTTYYFTKLFPIPFEAFTRQSRRLIANILTWPGSITGTEMNLLWGIARLADKKRRYYLGQRPLGLLTWMGADTGETSDVLDRLAAKHYVKVEPRPRTGRSGIKPIELAGPHGYFANGTRTRPEAEAIRVRALIEQHVSTHPGELFFPGNFATAHSASVHVVRQAVSWLIRKGSIRSEKPASHITQLWPTKLKRSSAGGRPKAAASNHDQKICEAVRANRGKKLAHYFEYLSANKESPPQSWGARSYAHLDEKQWALGMYERKNHIKRCQSCQGSKN